MTGLELTIEIFYQTNSHKIHFKMTGLVRRFSRRRNMSSNRIHSCHIIFGTEFKGKHILEQDELFCCAIISFGLKGKNKNKQTNKQKTLLSFSLPWEPQTLLLSSDTLNFLSSYLEINSLSITMNKVSRGDGIPAELFQILKDDAVKVLHSKYHQI